MPALCAAPVAVGAHDVALRRFRDEDCCGPQHRATRRESEQLGGSVSMVEVHLMRGKGLAAVGARLGSHLAQKFQGALLANAHTSGLESAIPFVVGDVGRPLGRTLHASSSIERMVGSPAP